MKASVSKVKDEELGLENRKQVLKYSLYIESHISTFLEMLLKIRPGSKSFGNSNRALNFNAKLYLMFDMNIINKEERDIMETFMAIRNQFMHNASCTSFESVIDYLDGKEKLLRKIYQFKEAASNEDNYRAAVMVLGEQAADISLKVMTATIKDLRQTAKIIANQHLLDAYDYTMRTVLEKADKEKTDSISISELQRIYTEKAEELIAKSEKAEYNDDIYNRFDLDDEEELNGAVKAPKNEGG